MRWCICSCLLLGLGITFPVRGADPAPSSQPAGLTLEQPYVDGSFGFSISPPRGGTTSRHKRITGDSDLEIVQFANVDQRWSLTVRVTTTTQANLDKQTIVDGITQNLGKDYTQVKVLRGDEVRVDARQGVRYEASFTDQGSSWLRLQAVIRTKPTEYFALVFITPFEHREWAEPIFDKVVASFRILRTEATTRRIDEALKRGRLLLESAVAGKVRLSEHIIPESCMRFVLDGKEIGFVRVFEREQPNGNHTGAEILEVAWLFNPDGSITHLKHSMYLTDDLSLEKWENRVYTLSAAKGSEPRQLFYHLERGLRQDNKLIVAFMATPNAPELQDRVIVVDHNYASAAWNSFLARIVDLSRPELYAFSTYNTDRRGMVLRTVEVMGPGKATIAGRLMKTVKIQDSEGLLPPINEIHVDSKGQIVRVVAGSLEMTVASKQDLEQQYDKRVREAEATMKKYPIHEPEPARRDRDTKPPVAAQPSRRPGVAHE